MISNNLQFDFVCTGVGLLGAITCHLFGGMDVSVMTLIILMILDYITGVLVAAIWKKSNKSDGGGLSSKAGWKGLCRKFTAFIFVIVAFRLDLILGTSYVRNTVIIGFIFNELVSLTENAGLMGVPLPKRLLDTIDLLKKKNDTTT